MARNKFFFDIRVSYFYTKNENYSLIRKKRKKKFQKDSFGWKSFNEAIKTSNLISFNASRAMFKTLCRASSRQQSSLKAHYTKIKVDVGKNRQNKIFCVKEEKFFWGIQVKVGRGWVDCLTKKKGQKGVLENIQWMSDWNIRDKSFERNKVSIILESHNLKSFSKQTS